MGNGAENGKPMSISKDKTVIRNNLGVQEENPVAKVDIRANNNCVPGLKIGPNNYHGLEFYEKSNGDYLIRTRDGNHSNGNPRRNNAMYISRGAGTMLINNLVKNDARTVNADRFKTAEMGAQPACNNV